MADYGGRRGRGPPGYGGGGRGGRGDFAPRGGRGGDFGGRGDFRGGRGGGRCALIPDMTLCDNPSVALRCHNMYVYTEQCEVGICKVVSLTHCLLAAANRAFRSVNLLVKCTRPVLI